MISCDGCRKTLRLEDLQSGRAREAEGRISCWECAPHAPRGGATGSAVCDGCGGEIPLDYLRRGLAVVCEEQFFCTRCKIKREREQARRLDARLIGSAILLFVVLPVSGGLVYNSLTRRPEPPEASRPAPRAEQPRAAGPPVELFNRKLARKDRRIVELEAALAELSRRRARAQDAADLGRLLHEAERGYRASFEAELTATAPEQRLLGLLRVAEIGDRTLTDLVLPRLQDADPQVRATAAKVLGAFGAQQASADLLRLLADRDALVQDSAARALSRITGRPLAAFQKPAAKKAGQ